MKKKLIAMLPVLLSLIWGTSYAGAQVDVSPGVARVSLIHGDVSSQRGDTGDWAAAAINQPIVSGDSVSTGAASRAEVQLDYANILRLGDNSQAKIASLTRTQMQVQVGQGIAFLSVLKGSEAEVEIDTPNVAVHPELKEGVYRIEVNGDETRVIVRKGEAQISTPQGSTQVEKGQLAIVRGSGGDTEYKLADAPSKDSWDSWNNDRNGVIRNAQSWSHTDHYYTGAEDLDAYGHWSTVPDYGSVWVPAVGPDWAPYRAGRWVWEPYWGWTWVSYEPWGWAPYHYGRWFLYAGSWAWWPGPVVGYPYYRPVWAPAYVSFFGFGGGVGVGFGYGNVGWLPVGPCDYYYPWYGRYGRRYDVVNVTNITNITNITNVNNHWGFRPLRPGNRYSNVRLLGSNERLRQAVSSVPGDHFGTGRVAPQPVSREAFNKVGMVRGDLPIVPTKASLVTSNRAAAPGTMHFGNQQFFTKRTPAEVPQPFEKEASRVQQSIQRTRGITPVRSEAGREGGNVASTRPEPATSPIRPAPVTNAAERTTEPGWRHFGSEVAQNRQPDSPPQNANEHQTRAPEQRTGKTPSSGGTPARGDQGWRHFSNSPAPQQPVRRDASPAREEIRGGPAGDTKPQSAPDRNDGFRRFTPQPNGGNGESVNRGSESRDQVNRFPSRGEAGPGAGREGRGMESSRGSRPPLDLKQPIVAPRSSGATPNRGGGSPRGGGAPAPRPSHPSGGHPPSGRGR